MTKTLRFAAVILALGAAPAFSQISVFTANEVRATAAKDRLREIRSTLKDSNERGRRLTARSSDAFRDAADWSQATENYYAVRRGLLARAAEIEAKIDAAMSSNTTEQAEKVRAQTEEILKSAELLRSDYEFYVRLPELAAGPERQAAQAAMRLLSQTGNYPIALAYFLDKTPQRRPFAPLSPAMTFVRLPY